MMDYGDEDDDCEAEDQHEGKAAEGGDEDVDIQNYKGIYFGEDPGRKFQCPITGAHFEVTDMCKRLNLIKEAQA